MPGLFGPTASFLQYTDIGISGFNENSSLAPLTFHVTQSQDSLRTALGFKASYDWKVGGVVIKPELRAAWQHEYGDNAYQLDSSFAGGGGDLFSVNGPKLGRDSLPVGAGFRHHVERADLDLRLLRRRHRPHELRVAQRLRRHAVVVLRGPAERLNRMCCGFVVGSRSRRAYVPNALTA